MTLFFPKGIFRRAVDMEEYEQLKELVDSADDDVPKASGGNKAA